MAPPSLSAWKRQGRQVWARARQTSQRKTLNFVYIIHVMLFFIFWCVFVLFFLCESSTFPARQRRKKFKVEPQNALLFWSNRSSVASWQQENRGRRVFILAVCPFYLNCTARHPMPPLLSEAPDCVLFFFFLYKTVSDNFENCVQL